MVQHFITAPILFLTLTFLQKRAFFYTMKNFEEFDTDTHAHTYTHTHTHAHTHIDILLSFRIPASHVVEITAIDIP